MYYSKQRKLKKGEKKKRGTHTVQILDISINSYVARMLGLLMVLKEVTSIAYLSLPCFNSVRIGGRGRIFKLDSSTKIWGFLFHLEISGRKDRMSSEVFW